MWSFVAGLVVLCGLASVLAAPTVHLIKPDDSEGVPDYQQLLPTDLPSIVDPVWSTVTMKPLVQTTYVEPLNPQNPPSVQPVVQPGVTSYQQTNPPTWPVPAQQNPPVTSYYPYPYYGTQTERPSTSQLYPPQPQQYPFYNVQPQFQYHQYQPSYPQLTWKPAAHVQGPCAKGDGGVQQAYHHQYLQRGY